MERFWTKVNKTETCWLWTGAVHRNGYGATRDTNQRSIVAHRMAWKLIYGDIPANMNVCHTCDNRLCVNPSHLWLGTQKDNIQDMHKKGRWKAGKHREQTGELNKSAVITEAQAQQALTLYFKEKKTQAEISKITGIKRPNVWAIVHRRSWTHLQP